jgi:histidinol-phosphate aminotransferase
MGLLDYYRQFDDVDHESINAELRARRAREKALALEHVPTLDLSSTEWPDFPNSEIMNAAIYAARGRVNGYPDRHAREIRRMLAERLEVSPEQVVMGNGAAELLQSATQVLMGSGDELVTPWPSYPLYPLMAQRAGAQPVAVDLSGNRVDLDAIRDAVGPKTRAVILCNPNDPTGTYLTGDEVGGLASSLPDHVHLLIDEAYIEFQTAEPRNSVLKLVEAFPRVVVFRTFSKIYGLSGLRAGYAVGSTSSTDLLGAIAPALGVNVLSQAGVAYAIDLGEIAIAKRHSTVAEQRRRVLDELHDLPIDAPESHANFVWLHAADLTGTELAARLEEKHVLVAPGGPLGADDHVRASIFNAPHTGRLLSALRDAVEA